MFYKKPVKLPQMQSPNLDSITYHTVKTEDGWYISLTHIKPKQYNPKIRYPIGAVHGFCQNRKAWKSGQWTTLMIEQGADIYLIELRGHGLSGKKNNPDLYKAGRGHDYCFDHYVAYDLPAALQFIKRNAGKDEVFLAGHSLGGMLGYAALPERGDIRGLISLGAPVQMDKKHSLINFLSKLEWIVDPPLAGELYREKIKRVPVKHALGVVRALLPIVNRANIFHDLWKKENMNDNELKIILGEGSSDATTKLVTQLFRWIKEEEFRSYTDLNHFSWDTDYKARIADIEQPILLVRGDEDLLATAENTRELHRTRGKLEEIVVPSTNHLGLTMGISVQEFYHTMVDYLIRYS
ncbi:MAG: alpha/beta fold hydrolase [Candidatus Woesearchaeota archaeon]